jgi:hypothetical protein
MVRGIVCYFLLVFCLLTKDGISSAFDVLVEKNPISLEMNFEEIRSAKDELIRMSNISIKVNKKISRETKNILPFFLHLPTIYK